MIDNRVFICNAKDKTMHAKSFAGNDVSVLV